MTTYSYFYLFHLSSYDCQVQFFMSVIPLPSLIPATLKLKDAFTVDVINEPFYESYNVIHFYDQIIIG